MVKRNLRRQGVLHQIPTISSSPLLLFTMSFATNNSNLMPAHFFPQVTSTHGCAQYTLDHAVGAISQVENCSFDKAFDGNDQYPHPPEVCYDDVWFLGGWMY